MKGKYDHTVSERSARRYARAKRVLHAVPLDEEHAEAIGRVLAATGETAAGWVRRMIRQEDGRENE